MYAESLTLLPKYITNLKATIKKTTRDYIYMHSVNVQYTRIMICLKEWNKFEIFSYHLISICF